MCNFLSFAMHGRQWCLRIRQTLFDRADQKCERRSKFMTHIAEKSRLRTVDLLQSLDSLPLLLVGTGMANGARDLGADQIEKVFVVIVEPQACTQASDDDADWLMREVGGDWQHDR